MNNLNRVKNNLNLKLRKWVARRYLNLAIFNIAVMVLILLHSAGYFEPFLPITINFIVLFAMILAIILLQANSRTFFILAILFWFFSAFIKLAGINIWAERTSIYVYQALVLAVLLIIYEAIKEK